MYTMYFVYSPKTYFKFTHFFCYFSFKFTFELFFQIAGYIKNRADFLNRFLSHLGTSAIMDLLLQLVAVPEGEQTRLGLAVVRCVEVADVLE